VRWGCGGGRGRDDADGMDISSGFGFYSKLGDWGRIWVGLGFPWMGFEGVISMDIRWRDFKWMGGGYLDFTIEGFRIHS